MSFKEVQEKVVSSQACTYVRRGGGGGGGELGQRFCQDENTLLEGYWNVGGAGGSKPERGRL